MKNPSKKTQSQHYVIQTYCSWVEPQYQTHIAKSLREVKEISDNVEKVEALYLLGKEISYSKNRRASAKTQISKTAYTRNNLDGYVSSADRLVALL
jgi:hypothetical protein